MKIFGTIVKIVTALAAVVGAIYVIATYGDKIVAWAKGLFAKLPACCCDCDCDCDCDDCDCDCECCCEGEEAAEEAADEVTEETAEEVVAADADFAE